jgi:hypothetical protein
MAAMVASHPGESAMQVAAIQIPVDHIGDVRPPEAVSGRIKIVPGSFQLFEMIFHALIICALFRFARFINRGIFFFRPFHGKNKNRRI